MFTLTGPIIQQATRKIVQKQKVSRHRRSELSNQKGFNMLGMLEPTALAKIAVG
jgi:hypothetical protein